MHSSSFASRRSKYGPHGAPLRGSLPLKGAATARGGPAWTFPPYPVCWISIHPMKHIARKRFGQHFLTDGGIIDAIVDAIAPKPGQRMVEIGPGLAALTQPLVERLGHLTVIELDRDLAVRLRSHGHLTVIESDVLKVDFALVQSTWPATDLVANAVDTIPVSSKLRVVGNLPYNISTPILFHLLDAVNAIEDQHFMLQKEVIDRMVAKPATAAYGRLSVMLQWRYAMENVLFVPPESFDPPPRVNSAIVRMQPLAEPPDVSVALLSELVQVAFSQRRKILRNTLGRWLDDKGFAGKFDVQRRAEEVPVAAYVELVRQVQPSNATT
jgi:16S rRNA (adenine1518-N6/adenine1519-N6)-dimethyltransferase